MTSPGEALHCSAHADAASISRERRQLGATEEGGGGNNARRICDQVIRKDPASRGTEESADVLVATASGTYSIPHT